ncbi:MAG: murein biosynthesis integral membrane protein MurJ [Patescibacteria group bacterium]
MDSKVVSKIGQVSRNAAVIAVASLISRVLGLFRDRVLAGEFGAGHQLDSYYAAFRIPDLIFNLLILGALSAAFIPIFSSLVFKDEKKAWRVVNNFGNVATISLIAILTVVFIFAPWLVRLITPGFSGEQLATTIWLTRIMLLSPLFFALSSIVGGVLNVFGKFFVYSVAPIIYNIGIIIGALYLVPRYGLEGLAYGVVIGAAGHFLVQVPSLLAVGYRFKPVFDFKDPHLKKILILMIPVTLGLGLTQINIFVDTIIGSWLTEGSIAVIHLANNLISLPIGLVGLSFATSVFPLLSYAYNEKKSDMFALHFTKTFNFIVFLLIPLMVLSLILRAQIVRLVLGAGLFDIIDTVRTSRAFGYFALGLVAEGLLPFLARIFYAINDTKTPLKITAVDVVVNVVASIFFAHFLGLGVAGLALGSTIAAFVSMMCLLYALRTRFPAIDFNAMFLSAGKYIAMSTVAGLAAYGMLYFTAPLVNTLTTIGLMTQTVFAGGVGIFVYLLLSALLKVGEADKLVALITRSKPVVK